LRLSPESELGLAALRFTDTTADAAIETRLNFRAGELIGAVRRLAQASNHEVKTLHNRIRIRGTDYVATGSGDVAIVKGLAVVYPNQTEGPGVTVRTGEFLETGTDQTRMLTKSEYDHWTGPVIGCPLVDISLVYAEWPARMFN
jgi:hypothetical protein